jgi:hypothetical protein
MDEIRHVWTPDVGQDEQLMHNPFDAQPLHDAAGSGSAG